MLSILLIVSELGVILYDFPASVTWRNISIFMFAIALIKYFSVFFLWSKVCIRIKLRLHQSFLLQVCICVFLALIRDLALAFMLYYV